MFKTGLNKVIEKHIPSKMIFNKHHLPWMNKDLKKMIKKKAKLHRKAKVSKEWTKFRAGGEPLQPLQLQCAPRASGAPREAELFFKE